jgi:glucokinase
VSGLWAGLAGGAAVPINGEGGHVTLAPADATEEGVVAVLRKRFGHCSAERAISGPGLVHLYEALCTLDGVPPESLAAADITRRADAGDARCDGVLELFFSFLGNVAGNLALTLGTRGGMYIGGGIVPRLGARIDRSRFRERFEQKGRFSGYLAGVPTFVVQARSSPALLGAARALDEL